MLHLTVLALHEEAIREDTAVMEGAELPEVAAEREAAQVTTRPEVTKFRRSRSLSM